VLRIAEALVKKQSLTPRPEEIAIVQTMFEMTRAGTSQMAIARELNEAGYRTAQGHNWSQPKVGKVLRDPIWIGELVNQAGTFKVMEPLIELELYEAAQRTLVKDGKRRGKLAAFPPREWAPALRPLRVCDGHLALRYASGHARALPLHGPTLRGAEVQAARRSAPAHRQRSS
jgi:hypothetical protein